MECWCGCRRRVTGVVPVGSERPAPGCLQGGYGMDGSLGRVNWHLAESQKMASGKKVLMSGKSTKNLNFGDPKSAERDRVFENWELKWKSPVKQKRNGSAPGIA